jgi:hypothetical protein
MSKPPGSDDQECADDRLAKAFRVSKKMRPFAGRMRMRVDDLDLTDPAKASQLKSSREEMRSILWEKKIPAAEANRAIGQTLEAAADHQLQSLRQKDSQQDRVRSAGDVGALIARLQRLAETIAKLPPVSKKKLNAIVGEHSTQFFDTETFVIGLMQRSTMGVHVYCGCEVHLVRIREPGRHFDELPNPQNAGTDGFVALAE